MHVPLILTLISSLLVLLATTSLAELRGAFGLHALQSTDPSHIVSVVSFTKLERDCSARIHGLSGLLRLDSDDCVGTTKQTEGTNAMSNVIRVSELIDSWL
ncbi:hypothetical protein WG66_010982 [Moniliophthora roreri]|nr:hypothetical protein WG66_010982 [Moniliophthora roreri]